MSSVCIILLVLYFNAVYCVEGCKLLSPRKFCQSASDCRDTEGLSGHVDCKNRSCCCANESEYTNYACYWRNYLGDKCKYKSDCLITNSVCVNQVCQCPSEQPIFKNGKCEEPDKRYLGDTCKNDVDCNVIAGAICSEYNLCECSNGKILKNQTCSDPDPDVIVTLYNECIKNNGVLLSDGTCEEYPHSIVKMYNVCSQKNEALFEEKCKKFQKCANGEVFDESSSCKAIDDLCRNYYEKIDTCLNDSQCFTKNSTCVNQICQCPMKIEKSEEQSNPKRLSRYTLNNDSQAHLCNSNISIIIILSQVITFIALNNC